MTTLTANVTLQPQHCIHKLPTSCRLTALPICCACQDKRAHSSSYSKYIDGVGFVMQGRRQERYCWQCKVFWDRRVGASGIPQAQTRIPDQPDQEMFLSKWYDWHRGFRLISRADGTEERRTLLGEPLREVDLGCLPRSIQDLRGGLERSTEQTLLDEHRRAQAASMTEVQGQQLAATEAEAVVPEEDRLFDDEPSLPNVQNRPSPYEPGHPNGEGEAPRAEDVLTAELQETARISLLSTLFCGIDETDRATRLDTVAGLPIWDTKLQLASVEVQLKIIEQAQLLQRDFSARFMAGATSDRWPPEHIFTSTGATGHTQRSLSSAHLRHPSLTSTAGNVRDARYLGPGAAPQPLHPQTIASMGLDAVSILIRQYENDVQRLQRRQRALAPLGTREEVEDPNYVSPVANMFTNFVVHHQQRMAARRRQANRMSSEDEAAEANRASELAAMTSVDESVENPYLDSAQHWASERSGTAYEPPSYLSAPAVRQAGSAETRVQLQAIARRPAPYRGPTTAAAAAEAEPTLSLDRLEDNRPPPVSEEDMLVRMECKICFAQVATVAVLPCGHCVMCQWCQGVHLPAHRADTTVPRDAGRTCPVCRKRVRHLARIYGPEQVSGKARKKRPAREESGGTAAAGTVADAALFEAGADT